MHRRGRVRRLVSVFVGYDEGISGFVYIAQTMNAILNSPPSEGEPQGLVLSNESSVRCSILR